MFDIINNLDYALSKKALKISNCIKIIGSLLAQIEATSNKRHLAVMRVGIQNISNNSSTFYFI